MIVKQETFRSGNSSDEATSKVVTNGAGNVEVFAKACASTSNESPCTSFVEVKISSASPANVMVSQAPETTENIDPVVTNVIKDNFLETSLNQFISWFKPIFRF